MGGLGGVAVLDPETMGEEGAIAEMMIPVMEG